MQIQLLKAKIQELQVTESDINYMGSISLPEEIMAAAGIRQFELVYVNNKTNGNRITTYAVKNRIRGRVTVNGAASKLFSKGDSIHVLAYAYMNEEEADRFEPTIVIADKSNTVIESKPYVFA
jgi:aspartate 1-decarboxylase